MQCKHCKKEKSARQISATDVQDSSTDSYLYRNKQICNDCVTDLMWEDYRVRTARNDKGEII